MDKMQDSGLSCFMIVMKFQGVPVTKEQAESISLISADRKMRDIDIVQAAKNLNMKARLCRLNVNRINSIKSPIIAKDKNGEFFIIAKSNEDKFMILFADKTQPEVKTRTELIDIWANELFA